MSAKNKKVVDKGNASFSDNDMEEFLLFCADDVEWTMVGDKTLEARMPAA